MVVLSICREIAQRFMDVFNKKLFEILSQSSEMVKQRLFKNKILNVFSLAHSENNTIMVFDDIFEQNVVLITSVVVLEWISYANKRFRLS